MCVKPVLTRDSVPRRGFTLVELLLVIVILGILAVIAAPRITPLLSGGHLRMGSRELAAAGRYARTMALLNQTPVDVILKQGSGEIVIKAREAQSLTSLGMSDLAALTNALGYTDSLLDTSARRQASLSGGFGFAVSKEDRESSSFRAEGSATNVIDRIKEERGEEVASTVSFSDTIDISRKAEGVKFWFDGYRDVVESRSAYSKILYEDSSVAEGGDITIRYRANGTVRPYRVTVVNEDDENDKMFVTVNSVGTAKITDEEDL